MCPSAPSAKQVAEEGIDLAKMNLVLLKKVEELTLHAIRQEQRLKHRDSRIESLQKALSGRSAKPAHFNAKKASNPDGPAAPGTLEHYYFKKSPGTIVQTTLKP